MTAYAEKVRPDSLFLACSNRTSEGNKTGSWRFLRPRYDEKTSPCSAACPAGEDIGRIEMLAGQGQLKEAWETILQENPFPGVCGRVCYHPCEAVCNRGAFDEPVAIQIIERTLAENAVRYHLKPGLERLPSKHKKVAVIGAGPSGLAAAYFLTLLGYVCEVFEARAEAGGILRYGIPGYRLPLLPLKTEIERISRIGFSIQLGKTLRSDFFEEAREGGYGAVIVGCGLWHTPRLAIPGEDLPGVEEGLSFLNQVNLGTFPELHGPVAVLGGGNTAIDVARSAVRLGAQPLILYRRRRQDMPAFKEEIHLALEEGVEVRDLWNPIQITSEGLAFRVTGQRMQVVDTDSSGRAIVEPIPGQIDSIRTTRIFKAIGLEALDAWITPPSRGPGVISMANTVLVPSPPGPVKVFVGDLAVTAKSVVQSVASAKEAALALDILFQKGPGAIAEGLNACRVGNGPALSLETYLKGPRSGRNSHLVQYEEINHDHFQFSPRIIYPRLLTSERVQSFAEINLKISADLAMREAKRCFNCGLCNQCDNCRLFCPDLSILQEDTPPGRRINYEYCKGCGICVVECPRNAMVLEEEQGS